jgi:hypothetical protein
LTGAVLVALILALVPANTPPSYVIEPPHLTPPGAVTGSPTPATGPTAPELVRPESGIIPGARRLPETTMAPERRRHHDRDDEGCSKQSCNQHHHNGDNKAGPIYICVQPGACTPPKDGQGPKYASLIPPTPQKIVEFVTTMLKATSDFVTNILKLVA